MLVDTAAWFWDVGLSGIVIECAPVGHSPFYIVVWWSVYMVCCRSRNHAVLSLL